MRAIAILFPILLSLTSRGQCQVSVDLRALDQAAPRPAARPAPERPSPATVARPPLPAEPTTAAGPASPPASRKSAEAQPRPKPDLARPKPIAPKTVTAAPAPPIPVLPTQQPAAPPAALTQVPAAIPGPPPPPIHVTFASGESVLSPDNEGAIRTLARAIPVPGSSSVSVVAYAAGRTDDPSIARRLSLSRGMAVRSVLIDSGVPATQIYVRALGAAAPSGEPADQAELSVARIGGTAAR